jgi:hypothetical protein
MIMAKNKKKTDGESKKIEYVCGVCGRISTVDESSWSVDVKDKLCCGEEMRPR